jgi:hypothetical protein
MDETTFAAFREFAVPAAPYTSREPLDLTTPEKSLFNRLLADNVLLEQEHISPNYAAACLSSSFALSETMKELLLNLSDELSEDAEKDREAHRHLGL